MKKALKYSKVTLYHYVDGNRIEGANSHMSGDCSDLLGNCSDLTMPNFWRM